MNDDQHRYPIVSDDEIEERMTALRAEGYPSEAAVFIAEGLVLEAARPVAESALRELVDTFDPETLDRLVRQHVVRNAVLHFDYCGQHGVSPLIDNLLRRGMAPPGRGPSGWTIRLPGGDTLEATSLCRVALLAVWLRRMRETGGTSTSAL